MFSKDGCVLTCTVEKCSYNQNEECHAPNIEVGDEHAMCDTFTTSRIEGASNDEASVAACNVMDCNFNDDRDCRARGITVSTHSGHADCLTFRPGGAF